MRARSYTAHVLGFLNWQSENGARLGDERIRIKGLGHIEVGAHFLAALAIELLSLCGEQNDVDVAQAQVRS